jgi:type VI secretion system VasI family protein
LFLRLLAFLVLISYGTANIAGAQVTDDLPANGKWLVRAGKSRLDDSPMVIATLGAEGFEKDLHSLSRLVIRCVEGEAAVYVAQQFLNLGRNFKTTVRIGAQKAAPVRWSSSQDGNAVGLWSSKAAIDLIKKITSEKTLFVRLEGARSYDFFFELEGIESAIGHVRKACKW